MVGKTWTSNYIVILLLSLILAMALCQSFQYSNGWKNGKRVDSSFEDSKHLKLMFSPSHCELQKLKALLQGNGNGQLYLLPCEFFGGPRRPPMDRPLEQFRRTPAIENHHTYY